MSSTSGTSVSSGRRTGTGPGCAGARAHRRFLEAFRLGLLVRATGDTIALAPPLIIERSQIDELIGIMTHVLDMQDTDE